MLILIFFFKHKTAYEMRISDWSSDVCSSDLAEPLAPAPVEQHRDQAVDPPWGQEIAEEFGFGELLARHDVETVDDAAIAIAHQLARPGMMAGVDRRIDLLHPCGEAGRRDEARARRLAAFPEDGGGSPAQRTERAGEGSRGFVH